MLVDRSALAACSPGRDALTVMPRMPKGGWRDLQTASASVWRD